MSVEITTAMVQQYKSNVQLLSQQVGSKLRGSVRIESVNAEYAYFEQIGKVAAQLKTSRHGDTPQSDTPHLRRRVGISDYEWADFIDQEDRIRTLIDPTSPYARNAVYAFGRSMDEEILEAALGIAYTGKAGATAVSFPAGQIIAVGSTGLTIAKLIAARQLFWDNDVDESIPLHCAVTGAQLANLLGTTEVTSSDYNNVKALVRGEVDTYMGFKFHRTNLVALSSTTRKCVAWAEDGILLGLGKDIFTKISERPDKSYLTQVYCAMTIGSTRMEEEKVVEIDCLES